jgi:hypothetical protein
MAERGKTYGDPKHRFALAKRMFDQWEHFRGQQEMLEPVEEQALRHGVYLLCDKLSRLAVSPGHEDTLTDLSGYSECIKSFMVKP